MLRVTYLYFVNGERYAGSYLEAFRSESEAQAVLTSIQAVPPPARYKPTDASDSVLDPYRDGGLVLQA